MRKYICNACGIRICAAEYQSGSGIPFKCTAGGTESKWHEVKEETVTDCNQLPKLTVQVFDRLDCPDWAKFAAVDADGIGVYYQNKPKKGRKQWGLFGVVNFRYIGRFDSSDWQNSLIERPAKALPDWCKVGEWGYDTAREEYFEVVAVTPVNVEVAYFNKEWTVVIGNPIFNGDCIQARKRPFSAEEMRGLVGKVIENFKYVLWCDGYEKESNRIVTLLKAFTAEDLIEGGYTVNREPCYVLEHLENGEWGWNE